MLNNLRAIVSPNNPWFLLNNHTDCEGILCHLFKYLSKSLNFNYTFIVNNGSQVSKGTRDGNYGRFLRNVFKLSLKAIQIFKNIKYFDLLGGGHPSQPFNDDRGSLQ